MPQLNSQKNGCIVEDIYLTGNILKNQIGGNEWSLKNWEERLIKITIEVIPFGQEYLREIIAIGSIINNGSGDIKYGNYTYKFYSEDKLWREGKIKKFFRLDQNVWKLLQKCLNQSPHK